MRKKTKILLLIVYFFIQSPVSGQKFFHYRSSLPVQDSSGFYKIALNPEILAKTHNQISDIRIKGPDGGNIAYLMARAIPAKPIKTFLNFPIYKTLSGRDSVFIFQNEHGYLSHQLVLRSRNTQVNRNFQVSGSDDLKNWYALLEDIPLEKSDSLNHSPLFSEQTLDIPYSSYRYYKITIQNGGRNPVEIMGAGIYLFTFPKSPQYEKVPLKEIFQKDSAGVTHLKLVFKEPYQINQIHYTIKYPSLFLRPVHIYSLIGKSKSLLKDTLLKSGSNSLISIYSKSQEIDWDIENGENPPLQFDKLEAFQIGEALIAPLEKGKKYQMVFGDSLATSPNYDLAFFADSLNKPLPLIFPNHPEPIAIISKLVPKPKVLPSYILWISILLALVLLGFLTFSLLKEIEGHKKQNGSIN